MARSLIHPLSTRERKHASVGVGVGGLVALDVVDREHEATATAAATAAAAASSRKLSFRLSFGRKPLALTVPATRNVHDNSLSPSPVVHSDSVLSSPSSASKSGVSSRVSVSSPSTTASPQSPLNKPLPPRPRRFSLPGLPTLPELPGSIPGASSTRLAPVRSEEAMGVLVPEPVKTAQMEGCCIRRPKTTSDLSLSGRRGHRRNRSDNSAARDNDREVSPTPQPSLKPSSPASMTHEGAVLERASNNDQPDASTRVEKKRTAPGHPVKAAYPMTPEDFPRHRAVTTDAVQLERDHLAHGLQEAQGQIEAALTQLSRSLANETMLKAQLSALQARLEDSNSQRVDALEQNLFLEEKLQHLSRRQNDAAAAPANSAMLVESRPTSRLLEAEEKVKLLEQQLAAAQKQSDSPIVLAGLTEQVEQYQRSIQEKETSLGALEQQNNTYRLQLETLTERLQATVKSNQALRAADAANRGLFEAQEAAAARLVHLERVAADQEAQLIKIDAEKAQLTGLLEAEVRRQAVLSNRLEHPNAPQLGAFDDTEQAMNDVKVKVSNTVAQDTPAGELDRPETPEQQIKRLEREIDYHVQDIVLYKLDVKGYKKDLKRANAKLKKLADAEPSRQMLSPVAGPHSASPSPSCVSAATSSAPNSAHPASPSPGSQPAFYRSPFPPPPTTEPAPVPVPATAVPLSSATNSNGKQAKRVITPPPAPFQKFATSTPITPTSPAVADTLATFRQRAHTGPARSLTSPNKTVSQFAAKAPKSHHRARSEVSRDAQPVRADSRDSAETLTAARPAGHVAEQLQAGEKSPPPPPPPRAIETQRGEGRRGDGQRNSLDAYGDVPNGGLPPIQMWGKK